MKLLNISILILCISCQINAKDQTSQVSKNSTDSISNINNAIIRTDTLWGHLNNDTIKDYITKKFYQDKIVFDIYIQNGKGYDKVLSSSINEHTFSDTEYFKNANLYNDTKGGISIVGFCCGNQKTVENFYYTYNDEVKNWLLNKTFTYSYNQDYTINYDVSFPIESVSINNITYPKLNVPTQVERNAYYKNVLSDLLRKFKSLYTTKSKSIDLSDYPKYILFDVLDAIPISNETVSQYNDLAYYLQQTSHEKLFAQYVLERITTIFPERIVAYINLGDTYWDLENFEKAKQAYRKYISLMKAAGNENKVPIIVWKRVSQ
jgi:hypothetical protein